MAPKSVQSVAAASITDYVRKHPDEAPAIWLSIQAGSHLTAQAAVESPFFKEGTINYKLMKAVDMESACARIVPALSPEIWKKVRAAVDSSGKKDGQVLMKIFNWLTGEEGPDPVPCSKKQVWSDMVLAKVDKSLTGRKRLQLQSDYTVNWPENGWFKLATPITSPVGGDAKVYSVVELQGTDKKVKLPVHCLAFVGSAYIGGNWALTEACVTDATKSMTFPVLPMFKAVGIELKSDLKAMSRQEPWKSQIQASEAEFQSHVPEGSGAQAKPEPKAAAKAKAKRRLTREDSDM
eukprot:6373051-Amphidinium_carterae.1